MIYSKLKCSEYRGEIKNKLMGVKNTIQDVDFLNQEIVKTVIKLFHKYLLWNNKYGKIQNCS